MNKNDFHHSIHILYSFLEKRMKSEDWVLLYNNFIQTLQYLHEHDDSKENYGIIFIPIYTNIINDGSVSNPIKMITLENFNTLLYKNKKNKQFFMQKKNCKKCL
jgi:hypothetical protein